MTHDEECDVAVVGLGTMGAMAAWQLARAGAGRVVGIEQFGAVHANGAYAGESRLFRMAAKEGGFYVPLLQRARAEWGALERTSSLRILERVGVLSIAPQGHAAFEASIHAAQEHGVRHELFDASDLRNRFPQFAVDADDAGLLDLDGGALRPERAVLAAAQSARALGADLRYDTTVSQLEPDDAGVSVVTDRGRLRARSAVVTAGAWTTRLLPTVRALVHISTHALVWMMPANIESFTPDRFPGFLRDLDGKHAFGVPTLDGATIKVTPTLPDLPWLDDVDDRPRELTREQVTWAGDVARRMIPDLVAEPVRWSLHTDSRTVDRHPVIDTIADGRIVVVAGMSGNGFKFAPEYGRIAANLALARDREKTPDEFRVGSQRTARDTADQNHPAAPRSAKPPRSQ